MRRFTTPTLHITLRYKKTKEPASDLDFDYILLTIENDGNLIERIIPYDEVEDAQFDVFFTQEETGSLKENTDYEAELNIMIGTRRIATAIKRFKVSRNLHNEVILT